VLEIVLVLILLAALAAVPQFVSHAKLSRLEAYRFPDYLPRRVQAVYPHLSEAECAKVMEGLRQFFAIAVLARGRRVAMPSQAVDVAWHEFILSTRAYQQFCSTVLGRFLHHTPAEAMAAPTHAQEGIRRAWALACRLEGIRRRSPASLPLLFALDAELKIPDGFTYVIDCTGARRRGEAGDGYCASHIGCSGSGGCSGGGSDGDGGGGGCSGGGD
jgi:hypothetical protein